MAIVSDGFAGSISVADNGGQVSTLQYELTAIDFIGAAADMVTILAALVGIIDGEVISYRVCEVFIENAITLPAAGVQIQDKASMTVSLVGGPKKANIKVPTPKIIIFTGASGGGADVIDISDGALLVYIALFEAGNQALISDGEEVAALLSGKRIHAKSNFG